MSHAYRCYLLDEGNRIAAVEIIECRDDRAATRKAEEILAAHPGFRGTELWDRERRVHVHLQSDATGMH